MIKVTVWNEFHHEKTQEPVRKIYPEGIHECIAGFLRSYSGSDGTERSAHRQSS